MNIDREKLTRVAERMISLQDSIDASTSSIEFFARNANSVKAAYEATLERERLELRMLTISNTLTMLEIRDDVLAIIREGKGDQ